MTRDHRTLQSAMICRYVCARRDVELKGRRTDGGRKPAEIKTRAKVAGKNLTQERHKAQEVERPYLKPPLCESYHKMARQTTQPPPPFLPSFLAVSLISVCASLKKWVKMFVL